MCSARDQMFFTKRIGIFMAEFLAIFINYVNLLATYKNVYIQLHLQL